MDYVSDRVFSGTRPVPPERVEALRSLHASEPVECPYPVVTKMGACCGHSPCDLEWYYPCEAEGGCADRSTCPGCATPVSMKPE